MLQMSGEVGAAFGIGIERLRDELGFDVGRKNGSPAR